MHRIAALALAAAVLLGACGGSTDSPEESLPAPTLEQTTVPSRPPSTEIDVEVKDGEVLGGKKRVKVPLNDEVRLSVRSDVADEVHVHGYDEKMDIPAGGGILMTFEADVPGVFEVELEENELPIVELEVR